MDHPKHMEVYRLMEEERQALIEAVPAIEKLLVGRGPVEVNSNASKLTSACATFMSAFKAWKTEFQKDSQVASLRVLQEYTLPVPDPPFILVPAKTSASASIGGRRVELGSYIYVAKDVKISPDLLCLLLKARSQEGSLLD